MNAKALLNQIYFQGVLRGVHSHIPGIKFFYFQNGELYRRTQNNRFVKQLNESSSFLHHFTNLFQDQKIDKNTIVIHFQNTSLLVSPAIKGRKKLDFLKAPLLLIFLPSFSGHLNSFKRYHVSFSIKKDWISSNTLDQLDLVLSSLEFCSKVLLETIDESRLTSTGLLEIIGKHPLMKEVFLRIEKVAPQNSPVLITGESGTGKDLVAKTIHKLSGRESFFIHSSSSTNIELMDSELFGHKRGAFTGAIENRDGLFYLANQGSIYLDQIGDLPGPTQIKLLRVVQEGNYIPLGSVSEQKVDTRVLASLRTNNKAEFEFNKLRKDLYFRLNVLSISLPPLRERVSDISILFKHFLKKSCAEIGLEVPKINSKVYGVLNSYQWPGNINELKNEVERIIILNPQISKIGIEHLRDRIKGKVSPSITEVPNYETAIGDFKKDLLEKALNFCNGNKAKTSKKLGIHRKQLYRLLQRYNLD